MREPREPSSPRVRGFLALMASAFAVACAPGPPAPPPQPRPAIAPLNVVVISLDAVRYDRTGLAPERPGATPNLVRFAEKAAVFHDATSPAPWTVPAHMSIWTGLFPSRHGMVNKMHPGADGRTLVEDALSAKIPTFPELLAKGGYTAAAFTGGAGVSGRFGFGRGFSRYVDDRRFAGLDYSMPQAITWLRENQGRPFFVFLHGYDAHGQHPVEGPPRQVAPWYRGRLDGSIDEQARLREKGLEATRIIGQPASLAGVIDRDDGRFLRDLYDQKIEAADRHLGAFLGELASLGLADRTIVAVVSDHGDEFMEHEHIDHGHTLLQEQLHTLLLLRFPGDDRRRDVRAPVQTLDLFPTVFSALGLSAPGGIDGRDLLPTLRGVTDDQRLIVAESDYRLFVHHRAVRLGSKKLVVDLRSGRRWLYDLASDPGELTDLAPSDPGSADALDALLGSWFSSTRTRRDTFLQSSETPIVIF